MSIERTAAQAIKDKHTLICLLAEQLAKLGISEFKVSLEQLCDLDRRDTTVKIVECLEDDSYKIILRRRKHDQEYVDYEIVEEPKQVAGPQKLLPRQYDYIHRV